jgi:hypothetical protein
LIGHDKISRLGKRNDEINGKSTLIYSNKITEKLLIYLASSDMQKYGTDRTDDEQKCAYHAFASNAVKPKT